MKNLDDLRYSSISRSMIVFSISSLSIKGDFQPTFPVRSVLKQPYATLILPSNQRKKGLANCSALIYRNESPEVPCSGGTKDDSNIFYLLARFGFDARFNNVFAFIQDPFDCLAFGSRVETQDSPSWYYPFDYERTWGREIHICSFIIAFAAVKAVPRVGISSSFLDAISVTHTAP